MKKNLLINLFTILSVFLGIFGESWAQEKKTGGGSLVQMRVGQAYVVTPKKTDAPFPFVLIAPDSAGLSPYFISEADAYAEMGVLAIVIDFQRGKRPKNDAELVKLNSQINLNPNYLKSVFRSSFDLIQSRSDIRKNEGVLITYGGLGHSVLPEIKTFPIKAIILVSVPPIMEPQELSGLPGNFFLVYEEQSQEIPKSLLQDFKKLLSSLNFSHETKFLATNRKRWWDYSEKNYNLGIGAAGRQFIIDSVSKTISLTQKDGPKP